MARRHSTQTATIASSEYEPPLTKARRPSLDTPSVRMSRRLSFGGSETAEFLTSEPSNELYLQRSRWTNDNTYYKTLETMQPPQRAQSGEGENCGGKFATCSGDDAPLRMPRRFERRLSLPTISYNTCTA